MGKTGKKVVHPNWNNLIRNLILKIRKFLTSSSSQPTKCHSKPSNTLIFCLDLTEGVNRNRSKPASVSYPWVPRKYWTQITHYRKKSMVDQLALKHIKIQQQKELRTWNGLNVDYIGRPGIQNIIANKKYNRIVEYFKLEDERWKYFLECMSKYKEIEEEKLLVE